MGELISILMRVLSWVSTVVYLKITYEAAATMKILLLILFPLFLRPVFDPINLLIRGIIDVYFARPLKVGQLYDIDQTLLVVEKKTIFRTIFQTEGGDLRYYANAAFAGKWIGFFDGSTVGGSLEVSVFDGVEVWSKIQTLKDRIARYLEQNSHIWLLEHMMKINEIGSTHAKMTLIFTHKVFQGFEEMRKQRSELISEIGSIIHELEFGSHSIK